MSRDTSTGHQFERQTDLVDFLIRAKGFTETKKDTLSNGHVRLLNLKGHKLYKHLEENGINYSDYISRKLLPDECVLTSSGTLHVFEKKFQQGAGSADEKLQTCHFKKCQYQKLMKPLGVKNVEYVYILSDWFKQPMYTDVLNYIRAMGCHYTFVDNFFRYNIY